MSKGYIFDFNGTLFWDTEYHDEAWMIFSKKYGLNITLQYLREELHGKVNREIFKLVFGPHLSADQVKAYSEEKEQLYRDILRNEITKINLAPGVERLLDNLKSNNYPMAIATSSPKVNVDFYIEIFNLLKWFPEQHIVFDDGNIRGKPAPDIFLLAISRLNLNPEDCIVVEDSVTGIKSARAAGIGKIFLVKSGNHLAWDSSNSEVEIIEDFHNFRF